LFIVVLFPEIQSLDVTNRSFGCRNLEIFFKNSLNEGTAHIICMKMRLKNVLSFCCSRIIAKWNIDDIKEMKLIDRKIH
ncbi:hypothetical protein, partial [Barnesiella intestinihominis]|uniref:hypothetical protein n=1 Tax=Barnesiella intestinihominis TaxID=487174 RepID=UPI002FDB2BA6